MESCSKCGSYAINPGSHGRLPGVDLHLCDVCYWRTRAEHWRDEAWLWEDRAYMALTWHGDEYMPPTWEQIDAAIAEEPADAG